MSELTETIRQELKDKETRYIYDDDLLNTYIATQIKTLREQRGWTQQRLAEEAGMKQTRISVLEDVNYSSWTAKVLRRLAQAFDLRLTIKFEEFNSFFKDFEGVKPELLARRSFNDDPAFKDTPKPAKQGKPTVTKAVQTGLHVIETENPRASQLDFPFAQRARFDVIAGTGTGQADIKPGEQTSGTLALSQPQMALVAAGGK